MPFYFIQTRERYIRTYWKEHMDRSEIRIDVRVQLLPVAKLFIVILRECGFWRGYDILALGESIKVQEKQSWEFLLVCR